jgi:hypothetical protein
VEIFLIYFSFFGEYFSKKREYVTKYFFQNMKEENLKSTLAYCTQLCQILAIFFYICFPFFGEFFFFQKRICNTNLLLNLFIFQNGENSPPNFLKKKQLSGEFSPPGDSHKNPA